MACGVAGMIRLVKKKVNSGIDAPIPAGAAHS